MKIRTSVGTANKLGLEKAKNKVEPTTAYLLLEKGCRGKCTFCPQSKGNREMVARVLWKEYDLQDVLKQMKDADFERVCIQTSDYPGLNVDLEKVLDALDVNIPISVCLSHKNGVSPEELKNRGVDRVGLPVDGASKKIVKNTKGWTEDDWEKYFDYLFKSIRVFGRDRVSTHIIIGMGETEKEVAVSARSFNAFGVKVALFALTPYKGSKLRPPELTRYRRGQFLTALLTDHNVSIDNFHFDDDGSLEKVRMSKERVLKILGDGKLLETRGCPGCNRPFYNESPAGPWFNFPRKPEKEEAEQELKNILEGIAFEGERATDSNGALPG